MFLELANRDPEMIATGTLLREGREFKFNYKNLPGSRQYLSEEPMTGFVAVKARVSIVTKDDLGFAKGDQILLDGSSEPLTVVNITTRSNDKQLMFLTTVTQKEITLDLE